MCKVIGLLVKFSSCLHALCFLYHPAHLHHQESRVSADLLRLSEWNIQIQEVSLSCFCSQLWRPPARYSEWCSFLFLPFRPFFIIIIQCLIMSLGSQVEIRALSSPECTQVMFFLSPTWNLERLYWLGVKFVRTDWERAHWPRALLSAIVQHSLVHTHTHTHTCSNTPYAEGSSYDSSLLLTPS